MLNDDIFVTKTLVIFLFLVFLCRQKALCLFYMTDIIFATNINKHMGQSMRFRYVLHIRENLL